MDAGADYVVSPPAGWRFVPEDIDWSRLFDDGGGLGPAAL